jgi:hypothetical protein
LTACESIGAAGIHTAAREREFGPDRQNTNVEIPMLSDEEAAPGIDEQGGEPAEEQTQAPAPPSLSEFHAPIRAASAVTIASLIVILDYLFYQGVGGLSFAVLFILLPMASAAFQLRRKLLIPLVLFGIAFTSFALRCAWQLGFPVVFVGTILLFSFPIILRLGRFHLPDLVAALPLNSAMAAANWYFDFAAAWRKTRQFRPSKLRGVPIEVVAIPVLVCGAFAVVFVLSNPIVQDLSSQWFTALEKGLSNFLQLRAPNVLRIMFWGGCALFLSMLLRPAIHPPNENSEWLNDTVVSGRDEGNADLQHRVAVNTLIGVNVLFLLYNSLDAYHLIIRDALPPGLNHSQYTHQGAFWLTVALAMTTVVVGRIFHGELNFHPGRKTLIKWSGLWLAQNFVLATWVFLRIHMYISYNGMTPMRIVALAGTCVVAAGLLLVTVKAFRRKSLTWLLRKELSAFILTCIILAVLPMDYLSWRFNTPRILASNPPRPAVQLTRQFVSPEGLATPTPLLSHPDPIIAEGVAALLGRWYFGKGPLYVDSIARLDRWTEYQLGHAWCARVLAPHEARILELVPDRDWNPRINDLRSYTGRWI